MTKRSSHEWLRLVALVLTGVVPVAWAADPPSTTIRPEEAAFFESRVRPVLVESCQKCHGPEKQTSGLRLDSREAILKGGASGPAVVPGKPDESLLVQAARRTHEDFKMPPKSKLPQPAVDALGQWVAMGAPWPSASSAATSFDPAADHWAFRPVRSPALPTVADRDWARTPVDPFVLARLEAAGLAPSREADRRALIRRITFDLLGLPPTPADIAAFEADTRPDAYERLVDRLLASPEYGERWARHWLDVARYSDTKGYVFQEERRYPFAYTFRDYVIRSLNEDKPYDTFLIEQIAADRMGPGGDPRSLAALGYLTLGRRFLNVREDIIDDRIDVVGRGMLGLTVGCARCHDHKFDPIPSEDYYSLFGVFASSVEPADLPEIPAAVPADLVKDYHAKVAQKQKPLDEFLAAKTTEIRADLSARLGDYLRLATELNFESRSPRAEERAKQANLTSGRLRGVMLRWKTHLDATRGQPDPVMAAWHAFAALPEPEFAKRAPELLAELTKGSDPKRPVNPALARALQAKPPTNLGDVAACYGAVLTEAGKRWEAASKTGAKALPEPEWEALRRFVASATGPLAINDETIPRWLARDERTKYSNLKNAVDAVKASHPGSPPRAMVLVDAPRVTEPRVLLRGNPGRPGRAVPRQFLKVASGPRPREPFRDGSGRLDLARSIASKDNPLTARVFVNRVWLNHFGAGLVSTPSDFGLRSDPPTHPELLDWLAADFMEHGWSIKHLHRRIVLSATYRQASDRRGEAEAKDPDNKLIWRFNRRRLEFEAMRDALLTVSGALERRIGGRPVEILAAPYPPRRTIYGTIDRQNLDGVYRTFDFASPDSSSPRRFVTTVPQQALFLMNSPLVIEQAKRLAARPELAAGGDVERVDNLYSAILGRRPDDRERATGLAFVANFGRDSSPAEGLDAWQSYTQALLLTNEFMFVD